jgi:hypothetical protein
MNIYKYIYFHVIYISYTYHLFLMIYSSEYGHTHAYSDICTLIDRLNRLLNCVHRDSACGFMYIYVYTCRGYKDNNSYI